MRLTPEQEEQIAQLARKIAAITAEPEYSVHARILHMIQLLAPCIDIKKSKPKLSEK